MTIIVDATPIVTMADTADPRRAAVRALLIRSREPLVLSAPVSAEIDYFMATRHGERAERQFLRDLEDGLFRVECLEPAEYATVRQVDRQYADLRLGLADLSIIVLARRFDTRRILTFDARHFRAVEALQGGRFTLLPDDA